LVQDNSNESIISQLQHTARRIIAQHHTLMNVAGGTAGDGEEAIMKRNDFLNQIQQTLVARRDAMRKTLAGDAALLRGIHDAGVGDEIDAALECEHTEMRSQMASFESRELAQIESALDKIKTGTYGHCERCERPIAPLRLKVLPYASECINCARRGERHSAPARGPVNRIAAYDSGDNLDLSDNLDQSLEEIS
jgi:DnaK suppressor protein